jgi:hypothetical protein
MAKEEVRREGLLGPVGIQSSLSFIIPDLMKPLSHYVHPRACDICTINIFPMAASSLGTVWWMDALCSSSLTMVMGSSWRLSDHPNPGQLQKVSSEWLGAASRFRDLCFNQHS